jgi:hypothetical protein
MNYKCDYFDAFYGFLNINRKSKEDKNLLKVSVGNSTV